MMCNICTLCKRVHGVFKRVYLFIYFNMKRVYFFILFTRRTYHLRNKKTLLVFMYIYKSSNVRTSMEGNVLRGLSYG